MAFSANGDLRYDTQNMSFSLAFTVQASQHTNVVNDGQYWAETGSHQPEHLATSPATATGVQASLIELEIASDGTAEQSDNKTVAEVQSEEPCIAFNARDRARIAAFMVGVTVTMDGTLNSPSAAVTVNAAVARVKENTAAKSVKNGTKAKKKMMRMSEVMPYNTPARSGAGGRRVRC